MPNHPKHALVLFDWDGFTSIVESSRVQSSTRGVLSRSSRGSLSYDGQLHKVEILHLSDTKEQLEDYDTEWAQTHRAKAIDEEKERRQASRGRRKKGGYLDIWNDPGINTQDDTDEDLPDPTVEQNTERRQHETTQQGRNNGSVKQGSKGRKITVLYEGSADLTNSNASPMRSPVYLDDLSSDEREIVQQQVVFHEAGKVSSTSQTDKVIVVQDEKEILELISGSNKTDSTVQTSPASSVGRATQTSVVKSSVMMDAAVQAEAPNHQNPHNPHESGTLHEKLDEILAILRGQQQCDRSISASEVYRWAVNNVPNGSTIQTTPSITIIPPEEPTSTPVIQEIAVKTMNIPTIVSELSPINNSENCRRENTDEDEDTTTTANPPPTKRALFSTTTTSYSDRTPLRELPENRKRKRTLIPSCPSNHTVKEISCPDDIEPGRLEFRIRRDVLEKLKGSSCSEGNFMWNVAKTVYHDWELRGRNVFGRKSRDPLSPRRVHLMEHIYIDYCGDDFDAYVKAMGAINSGIRSISRK
ncbi:uncharacterized protein LOC134283555 [Saccostrea cucullata]|uniref:uncharacterized protein LOC134283555 n=1 Tax=Saccostrea cuccullata TaxID=36930 RepID=UPI002ED27A8F